MPTQPHVILLGHGSPHAEGNADFLSLVEAVRERNPDQPLSHAFLEAAEPDLATAMDAAEKGGARDVIVLPHLLLGAGHVKNDIPVLIRETAARHPALTVSMGTPLGLQTPLVALATLRVAAAIREAGWDDADPSTICLVALGRGTSDPDANSEVAKLARMIEESLHLGAMRLGYFSVAQPSAKEALQRAAQEGWQRIVAFPLILFRGFLERSLRQTLTELAEHHTETRFAQAAPLAPHPLLVDAACESLHAAIHGDTRMNCLLCKYREPFPGYEAESGAPQTSHSHEHGHHHHGHDHGHAHEHQHGTSCCGHHDHTHDDHAHEHSCCHSHQEPHAHETHSHGCCGHHEHEHHDHHHAHEQAHPHDIPCCGSDEPDTDELREELECRHAQEQRRDLLQQGIAVHPIEKQSFEIIAGLRDWSSWPKEQLPLVQRLVHTAGDPSVADTLFLSDDAVRATVAALRAGTTIVCDITMVQSGLRRSLLEALELETSCAIHCGRIRRMAEELGITRSAAAIRRASERFGNDVILAIGDAPTAVRETLRLATEEGWRPRAVIAFPVGFVDAAESKAALRDCSLLPRITNLGPRGGSPWAAAALNALLRQAASEELQTQTS
jgi:precorrin isomerase/sirohydrochlorin ferrochelatase